jgi:hypothetical protein
VTNPLLVEIAQRVISLGGLVASFRGAHSLPACVRAAPVVATPRAFGVANFSTSESLDQTFLPLRSCLFSADEAPKNARSFSAFAADIRGNPKK